MDFDYSPKTQDLQARLRQFMDDHIYPSEPAYAAELAANTAAGKRWTALNTIEQAQAQGPRRRAVEPVSAGGQRCRLGL